MRTLRGVAAGLLTAQAVAAVHVRLAAVAHFDRARGLHDSGYIAVPGPAAIAPLDGWAAACCGGLFFTFTVGLGLTLLAASAERLWRGPGARSAPVRAGIAALWVGVLALLNAGGFSPEATAYGLLVPAATAAAAGRLPEGSPGISRRAAAVHLLALLLLAGAGARCVDGAFFSGIRDHLLLSNPAGIGINHFYYRYTLLAAQAFKSLDQTLLRTCRIEAFSDDPALRDRLARRLARLDWLPVGEGQPADMEISGRGEMLSLVRGGREILTVRAGDFLARPEPFLASFSAGADRMAGLRWLAYASLTGGCLLALYGLLYFPARWLIGRMPGGPGRSPAAIAALAAAVAAGGGISLVCFSPWERGEENSAGMEETAIRQFLVSRDPARRIAALAAVVRGRKEIAGLADPASLAGSPDLRERIWLARALAFSRRPATLPVLVDLLNDPRLNVAYQACHALGMRGDPRGIAPLLFLIGRSGEWYVELYAYRAARRLGWHPVPSG